MGPPLGGNGGAPAGVMSDRCEGSEVGAYLQRRPGEGDHQEGTEGHQEASWEGIQDQVGRGDELKKGG